MEHPNIARVLDAGATDSGRPYFVMELVRGIPVTNFCDQNRFTVEERLKLFVTICNAVQHAHQKGIIHRDIKPSNVMVTLHDGMAVAKVIDFGVAKATGQRLTDKTLFTGFAQMVGTPLYMSPEQAEMSGLDVDTRSDIYSLGVLLYELLTGTTPFDKLRMKEIGYDEFRRIIREEEPPRPSTRLSTLGHAATLVSSQRKSDARKLRQSVRGELDWIVMKCLDKDRNRRYESAGGLARDIGRYLINQPVEACPPSARYRFRKFVRRNKVSLTILGMIIVAITLTVVLVMAGASIVALRQKNYKLQGYRPVAVETKPDGARVALVPINPRTGEPDPDSADIVRPREPTPLTVNLKPGRYFVEAVLPGNEDSPDFAEVEVTVPATETTSERAINENRRLERPDDYYLMPSIAIPPTSKLIADMVAVPIGDEFRRKNSLLPELLYVDVKETMPSDSRRKMIGEEAKNSLRAITFEDATERARERGLRLPIAVEYDAISKSADGHQLRYGDSGRPVTMDDLSDGLAEWTPTLYQFPGSGQQRKLDQMTGLHVLKGYGDLRNLRGLVRMPDALLAPADSKSPMIGFRCVRSGAPRFIRRAQNN
jgi:hypothetical protein